MPLVVTQSPPNGYAAAARSADTGVTGTLPIAIASAGSVLARAPGVSGHQTANATPAGIQRVVDWTETSTVTGRAAPRGSQKADASDPEELVEKIVRTIFDRLATESERRGWTQWS